MDKKELKNIFDYMFTYGLSTFINMYNGKPVSGFTNGSEDAETSKLIGKNGDSICFQYCSITEGTNRELQLRSNQVPRQEVDARINLSDLFSGKQVVIITGGDSLYGLAPVLDDKVELLEFIRFLRDYYQGLSDDEKWSASRHLDDMESLAIWLYKNNPQERKKSLLDEIDEKLNKMSN